MSAEKAYASPGTAAILSGDLGPQVEHENTK
jgi:hypothetical protein